MARDPAEWRSKLTDAERKELALAERARDVTAEHLRVMTKKLKDRCIKRLRREAPAKKRQSE